MSILRTASKETTKIMLDDTDFIEVRSDLSKREFNALASGMPQNIGTDGSGLSLTEATKFQTFLFESLVVGWSLKEKPTVEAYEALSAAAAQAVDEKVASHFESLLPSSAEGK
jgi:hypothetical protein